MALKQYQRYIVTTIPVILVLLVCYYFADIVTYIILAWILSMIGAPIYDKLRPIVGKTGGAIGTLLTFFIFTMLLVWLVIPPIIQQTRNFSSIDYEEVLLSLEEPLNDWNDWLIDKGILHEHDLGLEHAGHEKEDHDRHFVEVISIDSLIYPEDSARQAVNIILHVDNQIDHIEEPGTSHTEMSDSYIDRLRKNLVHFLNPARISQVLSSIFGALGNTLVGVMSVFFIAFFFLKERGLFSSMVKSFSSNKDEDKWTTALDESASLLKRYFIGIALQVFLVTLFVSGVLTLLGFKNALLIGFFAALMNVIPYLGPMLGAGFAIIITISSSISPDSGAEVVTGAFYDILLPKIGILILVFTVMQFVDNFIIQPNIFSKSVKAHPLEIFLIILVGAKLGGVLGMVIAIPMYTILRVIAKVFLSELRVVQRITQNI